MKMRPEVYESLLADIKAIIAEIDRTGLKPLPGKAIDPDSLTNGDMWDLYQKTLLDRANGDHPMHRAEEVMGRVLEFTDRSPYFLYNDEGLDDGHIETAFRRMIGEIASERTPSPAL